MSQISNLENRYSLFEQGLLDEAQANQLRQDVADAASARDIDLFEDQRTASGQLYESGKGVARGLLTGLASVGEGLGEQADAITNKLGFEDLIDSGEENELVRLSRAAQESIQEKLSADVEYRDQWLTKFSEGAGSFGSFLLPGGVLKLAGASKKLSGGIMGGQTAAFGAARQAQGVQGARDQGIDVSQDQEDSSILWGSLVGLTELLPIHRILSRITKSASPAFKAGIAAKIKGALVSGGIEGIQEVAASIMQDAVERGIYNEELPFNDSLMDDFTVGGAVGAAADLALNVAAGRSGRKRNRQAEQDLRTAEQDAVEGLAGEVTEGQIQERAGAETALPDFVVEDDATPDDLVDFQKTLDQEMKGAGLSDVKANIHHALRNVLRNNDGNLVFGIRPRREGEQDVRTFGGQSNIVVEEGPKTEEGVALEGLFSDAANQIFVAADALPKEGTLDEQRDSAVGILKHEQLHAMRAMDLFTDSEWTTLTNAVNQRNKKGTNGTYFDWASNSYDNLSPVELVEEAVAEMTRDLRADNTIVTGKPRTLIQRIIDFFPKLNNFIKGRGYSTFDSLVRDIDSGKVGGRKRGEIRTLKNLEGLGSVVRQPDFDVSGTINQEREDDFVDEADAPKDKYSRSQSRMVGAPQTGVRPEVANAYRQLQEGTITREGYDTVVLGTISEYDFVPKPATNEAMSGALDSQKRNKINLPIEDGADVGLRLDIPAYTDNGVWVPTIHQSIKGSSPKTSHRATAAITNVDFTRSSQVAAERIMEGRLPGTEGYLKRERIIEEITPKIEEINRSNMTSEEKKTAKSQLTSKLGPFDKKPFAQVRGSFVNRTDAQNEAIAQEALNSPEWTQVGFDPRRHSYFYDRKTGEPVTFADEVVQVGPLVLAKNATKNTLADGSVFKTKFSKRKSSTPIENAVELATTKYADYNTAVEEEFFGEFWPRMMAEVKGTVTRDKVRTASKRAVKDINEFVSRNPKYQDYYDNDQKAVKLALEQEFPGVTPDDLAFYQLANGLSSPATSLPANVGDALNFLSLYKRDGNLDAIEMGLSAKGNPVIAKAPFSVSGTTGPTKARSLKVIDRLIKENSNSPDPVSRAVSFLKEKVTPRELQKFNKSMGYKSAVSDIKAIRSLVKQATGQDEKIPRMFIFGKKVGAYTLNLVGEGNYTTIDVWESRFVRSYFEGLFDKRYGIPKTVDEDVLFQEFSSMFKQEYEKDTGSSVDASTLQAMRWFYIINAAKQSGYRGASTSETISELTEKYIGKREAGRVSDAGRTESDGSAAQEVRSEGGDQALQDKFSRRVEDVEGQRGDRDRGRSRTDREVTPLAGSPDVEGKGPIQEIVGIAESYAERKGIPYQRQPEYVKVDPERATRIAEAYENMPHAPQDPEVQEAYQELINQTKDQYDALIDNGYSFTFFDGETDPYGGNPFNAMRDLRYNKTMAVYGTYDGYGTEGVTGAAIEDNPMLADTGLLWKDQQGIDHPVTANDLFRAVHDAFGHGIEGAGFRARGEENAWLSHSKLFTGPALKAITSETRGQNSWVNYGPYGEANQTAKLEDTVFAEQKTGLMPSFTWTDGALPPMERERADGSVVGGDPDIQKVTRDAGAVQKVVEENEEAAETPSVSVPPFSTFADPEAQFVAKNPQDGLKPTSAMKDKFSRRKEPPLSPELSKIIDGIAAEPPPNITPGETYLKNTETSNLQYFLDKSKQSAINKYARLERYSRDPLFKENLADTSAIAAAYFADRSMGITGAALKYGVPVYQNGVTQVKAFYHNGKKYRGLIDVMAPLYQNDYNFSLERLAQSYAIALRAEGQRARGLKTPVPEGQLQEIEAEIAKYKNKDGVPIIKEWYEVWQAFNGKTVEFMKATGIVDDALAQKWLEMSDYVPFYRQAEAEDGEIANIGVSAPVMFKRNMTSSIKLKELKGSEKAVNVPMLDAITRNLSMAIDAGMKNVAQQRIVRDMVKIGIAEKATTAQRKNISQNFVVNFKVKGVDQYYKIHDPLIYESLQSTEEMGGVVTGLFGGASTILREMVTREPGFMFANLMRDTLSAYVTSGADFTPVVDTVAALGKDVEQLESFGVVGGYDFGNDPKDMVKAFSKESRKRGISMDGKGPILNPFTKIWDWAGKGTTLSDAATRRAVYDDVLARTGNEAEAAFQALEVINFSRRGRNPAVRFLTTAIPFLNARFQGLDVLYRGFMGYNPAQKDLTRGQASLTALSRGAIITATTLMYWLMFSDSEEYKEATDEQRDLNWIFPNPFGGRPIRIPVPFEVGLLFKTIPERIFDSYSVAKVFGKTGDTSDRELFESVVQRGIGSTLAVNPLGIQLVGPLLEAAINHNVFTSSPIVPIYVEKNGLDGLLGRESNTQIAKAIGLASNINPVKIDHVLYGYTGTIGAYVLDSIDRLILKNPEITGGNVAPPTLSPDQYPVLKRFLISKFSDGDRQDFYRLRAEVEKVTGTMKKLDDAEKWSELEAVIRTKGHLAALAGDVSYISKQLTTLRKQREQIERLPVSIMSGKEKQEAMDEILEEMSYVVNDVSELKRIADLPATSGLPLSDVINILSK